MIKFSETDAASAFIATADRRDTSFEVMRAIAGFARNLTEAEAVWNGDLDGICHPSDIYERATNNGLIDADTLYWGGWTLDRVVDEMAA